MIKTGYIPENTYRCVVIYLLLISCISSYEPKLEPDSPKLTVDGWISDQPGTYTITLRYSSPYINNEIVFTRYAENASVTITDDAGGETQLTYEGTGKYQTSPTFAGQAGRSYVLNIMLQDGTFYQSQPEMLKPVPPIDTIYTSYKELSKGFLRGEFSVFFDFMDLAGTKDYYQWDWTHYKLEQYCHITPSHSNEYDFLVANCCGPCWSIDRCYGCINIFSDTYYEDKKISRVPVLKIPYDSKAPYFVQIRLKSLTESAFKFWYIVSEQINNSGGIFDKPPVTIKGNIVNVNNPNDQVLGYFGASAIYEVPIYIDRSKIDKPPYGTAYIYRERPICIECSVGPYRTDRQPTGW
ncbi:MAG TPA: DUF4249 domain-containing protein [Cyclobacteriaceae bacterium]|nr:DUF4249 domain-containing protein [Cyclobacteriaceae bacterium]HRF34685.1 DUF4249 domain-containing protein [Cyclobacteriaceae bacterium]